MGVSVAPIGGPPVVSQAASRTRPRARAAGSSRLIAILLPQENGRAAKPVPTLYFASPSPSAPLSERIQGPRCEAGFGFGLRPNSFRSQAAPAATPATMI